MRAAVVTSFDRPLEIEDRARPQPRPGEVLVRIETSGQCHTDIHATHGDWPVKPALPFVPGHEGVGIVEQLGSGVSAPAVGQRVAVPWLSWACGECEWCIRGWETLCPNQRNTGYSCDGASAEYCVPRSCSAHRRPLLAQLGGLDDGVHAAPSPAELRLAVRQIASMSSVPSPAARAARDHLPIDAKTRAWVAGSVPLRPRTTKCRRRDEPALDPHVRGRGTP
jgi:threonine dehydrogenase-like Zn-dependent dehydrogenase